MIDSYDIVEWYEIKGRGQVAVVWFNGDQEFWNPAEYVGKEVILDGEIFTVKGVDMYRHMISPSRPYRQTIGLLV